MNNLKKQKKKKMKRKIKIIFLVLVLEITKIFSQNIIEKDTFYFMTVIGSLPNKRPIANIALLDSISYLNKLNKDNQDNFICDFYKLAILSEDPILGFHNQNIFSVDSTELFLSDINLGLIKMRKHEKKINVFFKDKQNITVYINRIVADFWKLPISEKSIRPA